MGEYTVHVPGGENAILLIKSNRIEAGNSVIITVRYPSGQLQELHTIKKEPGTNRGDRNHTIALPERGVVLTICDSNSTDFRINHNNSQLPIGSLGSPNKRTNITGRTGSALGFSLDLVLLSVSTEIAEIE